MGGTSQSSPYIAGLHARGGHVATAEGPGWDGPTGLGTPNGLAAFR
ncbi:hypothetical protein [Streptacidiphilus neutrinimicus]|nr:hypothetical protein [Streptacidiphilus neutrinimicus]